MSRLAVLFFCAVATYPAFMPGRTDKVSRVIDASPDALYRAFADPERLIAWLPPAGMTGRVLAYEFRVGGEYAIELTYDEPPADGVGKTTSRTDVSRGRFVELVPGRRVAQSVVFDSEDPGFAGEMVITWDFLPVSAGTDVTVTAENVPAGVSKADHDAGLTSSIDNLASHVLSAKV